MSRRASWFAWFWFIFGALYFTLPLFGTFIFSLQKVRGTLSLAAYQAAFADVAFWQTFLFSCFIAALTIVTSLALIVPTAFWVTLRMPRWRPVVEFITLLPFVIPAIVLVFGVIKTYGKPITVAGIPLLPSLLNSAFTTNILLVAAYTVLSLPYMYRATDNGLRAMDVRTLTEAAQSLGANWFVVLVRVIMPNLRTALLSGALLTFAIVLGEFTIASFLARPMFGPYLQLLVRSRVYEPAALTIVSFGLTWLAMGVINWITSGTRTTTVTGAR